MSRARRTLPTPRRREVDLTQLAGLTVLGEPLAVLLSGLLRLRLGAEHDGMMEMSGALPKHEAESLRRAMARVERRVTGDRRTTGQRELDRFLAVAERVTEAAQVAADCRARSAFVKAV
jgi:hypothetical protein